MVIDRHGRLDSRRRFAKTLVMLVLATGLVPALPVASTVQAASQQGGGAFTQPAAPKPKVQKREADQPKVKSSGRSISGRWTLKAKCNVGSFTVILNFRQTSSSAFTGTGKGITTGYNTVVQNGRISGRNISFSRRSPRGGATTFTKGVLSADGRRIVGTEGGAFWSCKSVVMTR